MLKALLVFLTLLSLGCTTLIPIEASPDEIQRRISSSDLLRPGDRVRVVTEDGSIHEFRVAEIDADEGLVIGEYEEIRVQEIAAVEMRELNVGKTAARAGVVFGALLYITGL